jgi:hypothetical protein
MTKRSPAGPPAAENPRLTIDRLRLRAAGLDGGAARHLATLVGQALVPSLQLTAGCTAIDTLRVDVAAQAGEGPELLSQRIVDAVGRALGTEEVAP